MVSGCLRSVQDVQQQTQFRNKIDIIYDRTLFFHSAIQASCTYGQYLEYTGHLQKQNQTKQ